MVTRYPQSILLSCQIPWDDEGRMLEGTFRDQVRALIATGFHNLYIFGTAGEGYAVTLHQFQQIVRVFHEETRQGGASPMVGVIGMSTAQIVERIGFAHALGIRAFQIALPPWGAVADDELMTFFTGVCGAFPDASFIHCNLPRARRLLRGPDYRRLADAVPNLAGTKNCRSDIHEIHSLATEAPELQHFYGEVGFPIGCLHGECSLLSSFGALFPAKTKRFFEYGVSRRFDRLFPMQVEYEAVMNVFLRPTHGQERMDGAYDKMITRASGIEMPLRLLPPYHGFDEATYRACVHAVETEYPEWLKK